MATITVIGVEVSVSEVSGVNVGIIGECNSVVANVVTSVFRKRIYDQNRDFINTKI